jgi:hypothetical protein
MFKPHIQSHEMDGEVQAFEETILYFADAYHRHGPGSQPDSPITPTMTLSYVPSAAKSGSTTPELSPSSSVSSSRAPSFVVPHSPSLSNNGLSTLAVPECNTCDFTPEGQIKECGHSEMVEDRLAAWQLEAVGVDRSVRILPGVKEMMNSLPQGKYAVATSGAKTYGSFISFWSS